MNPPSARTRDCQYEEFSHLSETELSNYIASKHILCGSWGCLFLAVIAMNPPSQGVFSVNDTKPDWQPTPCGWKHHLNVQACPSARESRTGDDGREQVSARMLVI